MSTLTLYKGILDIAVSVILTVNPNLVYHSFPARWLGRMTELHLSDPSTAPGFNQAIACMVASVGVGHVVASRSGPNALPAILAMNLSWGVLSLFTCLIRPDIGSATVLMTAFNHLGFSAALAWALKGRRNKRSK